jgi:KDO2-lipid IV(A) lauroyltransferase
MLTGLMRLLAGLPLSWLHASGAALGWIVFRLSSSYAERVRTNLRRSGLWRDEAEYRALLRENMSEAGRAGVELIPVGFRPIPDVLRLVQSAHPLGLIEEAEARGKGIVYLTPHLGCPDIAALWAAQRRPITVLYRPPKMAALQPLIEAGRGRGGVELAPATLSGVRRLLKALRRGNTVGILPDQAPSEGEGAWADFFGRPAYTMTLVGRLVEATGATVIMAIAERLPHAQGYAIRLARPDGPLDGPEGMRNLNAAVEKMIALRPGQYLWGYNRYKVPSGVAPPPTDGRGT